MNNRCCLPAAAVVLSLACIAHAATFEKIAMNGELAGDGSGLTYSYLGKFSSSIGPDGHVIFNGGSGVWGGRPGDLKLLAQQGVDYASAIGFRAASNGQFVFTHNDPLDRTKIGLWTSDGVSKKLIATRSRELASFWNQVVVNRDGKVAFREPDEKVWLWDGASLGLVSASSDMNPVGINDAGEVLFKLNDQLWRHNAGTVSLVGPGGTYFGTALPFNDAGQSASARWGADPMPEEILVSSGGTAQSLVALRDAAPESGPGASFAVLDAAPLMNNAGQVLFGAGIGGVAWNRSETLWKADADGSPVLVLSNGAAAPGLGEGVTFTDIGVWSRPNPSGYYQTRSDALFNNLGQILLEARDSAGGQGIWFIDEAGEIHLLLRSGQIFDVDESPLTEDVRVIQQITVSAWGKRTAPGGVEEYGTPYNFTDDGQFIAHIEFTDGSEGLFLGTVPEPATFALLLCGGAATLLRRRGCAVRPAAAA